MNKKLISTFICLSMLASSISGCSELHNLKDKLANNGQVDEAPITSESPYYYVTNGSIIKERNHYMELEVKVPKIMYSNVEEDPVLDPINKEIDDTIMSLIEESKDTAFKTYKQYLETAKTNIKNDKAKALDELKKKYKSILTDDEVKAISMVKNAEVYGIATWSMAVDGFTSTEDIINAGPHNKKIIIVEKEQKPLNDTINAEGVRQASIDINGRPGRGANAVVNQVPEKPETDTKSTVNPKLDEVATISKAKKVQNAWPNNAFDKKATKSSIKSNERHFPERITDEITLDNFYRELARIELLRVPSEMYLTREYTPMYIYCDFDVTCLDEDFISIYINIYETRKQIVSKVLMYNIDLKNKKLLSIQDILGENYKELSVASIKKTIESWSEDKKSLVLFNKNIEDFITSDVAFFINNNHNPVIVFDKYAITAGAAGYPEFQIVK